MSDDVDVGQTFISIAGPVGADKEFFTKLIGDRIESPRIKFSAYLKKVAERNGRPETHLELQNLGMEVIAEQGWPGFCSNVLRLAGDNYKDSIVVDGVRHILALKHLQTLTRPYNVYVVYVDVTREQQVLHLRDTEDLKDDVIDKVLSHPVEAEATLVRRLANFVIRTEEDARKAVDGLADLRSQKGERDREAVYKVSGVTQSLFDSLQSDVDRYESLRAIVFLLKPLGAAVVQEWLRAPQYELSRRTPLEVLQSGDPRQAIDSAVRLAEV